MAWWAIFALSRYLQVHLHDLETRNFVSRGTVELDGEGRATVVAAHEDPGTPNWLDLGGRTRGQVLLLWSIAGVDANRSQPSIETEVAPLESLG